MAYVSLKSSIFVCLVLRGLAQILAAAASSPPAPLAVTDQPFCRALFCDERGIVLLFARISYNKGFCISKKPHIISYNNGFCIPGKQHVYVLSSAMLGSDPGSC